MKKVSFINTTLNLLFAAFLLVSNFESIAQEKELTNPKSFKLVMEKTDYGVKMQSFEGSAWIDLSFSLDNHQPQAIDEYGMTKLNKVSSRKDSDLADFLFTITKNGNSVELKGIEGTTWEKLSFTLDGSKRQAINQNGMTQLD